MKFNTIIPTEQIFHALGILVAFLNHLKPSDFSRGCKFVDGDFLRL